MVGFKKTLTFFRLVVVPSSLIPHPSVRCLRLRDRARIRENLQNPANFQVLKRRKRSPNQFSNGRSR